MCVRVCVCVCVDGVVALVYGGFLEEGEEGKHKRMAGPWPHSLATHIGLPPL